MSLSDAFESDALKLFFQNTNIVNLGDASGVRGSAVAGSLYVSLHTSDPTDAGTQTTSEATYTSYARAVVVRSSSGWTVSGTSPTQVANAAIVSFPACTGGANTITHFAVGRDSSAGGEILWSGALTASLAVSNGITPNFAIGALALTID